MEQDIPFETAPRDGTIRTLVHRLNHEVVISMEVWSESSYFYLMMARKMTFGRAWFYEYHLRPHVPPAEVGNTPNPPFREIYPELITKAKAIVDNIGPFLL